MGILKALNLVPQGILLCLAVGLNFLQLRQLVYQLTILEDRLQQIPHHIVVQRFDLPSCIGVKDVMGLFKVDGLIPQADLVRQRLSAVLVIVAVDTLKARVCDLGGVLTDLDLRNDLTGIVLHSRQLVDAAEHRLAP